MANNRMYLVHRPSGRGIFLGSRGGWGYHPPPPELSADLGALYAYVEQGGWPGEDREGAQDDFAVLLEIGGGRSTPYALAAWQFDREAEPLPRLIAFRLDQPPRTPEPEPEPEPRPEIDPLDPASWF